MDNFPEEITKVDFRLSIHFPQTAARPPLEPEC